MFPTFQQRLASLTTRLNLITGHVFTDREPIAPFDLRHAGDDAWAALPHNTYWGRWQTDFEMRGAYTVPERFAGRADLALWLPLGNSGDFEHPEALLRIDSAPIAAIDRQHQRVTLSDMHTVPGQTYALHLTGWTGLGGTLDGDARPRNYIGVPAVVVVDRALEAFVALARTCINAINVLDENHPVRYSLLDALDTVFSSVLDTLPPLEGLHASIPAAHAALTERLAAMGAPHPLTLHAIGHAHIDTAWLWTLAVTRGKVERTFHSALHLMRDYPEYIFASSAPQHYDWFRQQHPDSYAELVERVREGRWEPIGGMWIEPDCNATGPESLVRQLTHGRRFFREQFGEHADTPVLWLPDTFGFPASLPQLAVQAGLKWFFTIKLRWNEVNTFPHDTFWWQGLDGSRLLAHLSTVPWMGRITDYATYNADPSASSSVNGWIKQRDKSQHDVLMAYGWGDGGGGPTREMLESLRTLNKFPGLPVNRPSRAREFYERLESTVADRLPTWDGELYLETHQGTLTSQSRIKRHNHAAEKRLHDLEFIASYARLHVPGYAYPFAALNAAWETVLLHQFHDILPGSSIDAVYEDADSAFAALNVSLDAVQAAALDAIRGRFGGGLVIDTVDSLYDSFRLRRHAPEALPDDALPVIVTPYSLENEYVRAEFDAAGSLIRFTFIDDDVELMAEPGTLVAYEDRPAMFDAWNIDAPLLSNPIGVIESDGPPEILISTPEVATIQFRGRIMNSPVIIRASLRYDNDQIEFETDIDWREKNVLVRAEFPLNIHARQADFGVQWGHVTRPTHSNTSWDAAQWEVPFQRWIRVGNQPRAVALIADGLYGGSVRQERTPDGRITNRLTVTLVKRASTPAPIGDDGPRTLRYAVKGLRDTIDPTYSTTWIEECARAFAHPVIPVSGTPSDDPLPAGFISAIGGVIETIKRSEDDTAFIVRLYEAHGTGHRAPGQIITVSFGFDVASVYRADLHETPIEELPIENGNAVSLVPRPFEIVTLRVTPR